MMEGKGIRENWGGVYVEGVMKDEYRDRRSGIEGGM